MCTPAKDCIASIFRLGSFDCKTQFFHDIQMLSVSIEHYINQNGVNLKKPLPLFHGIFSFLRSPKKFFLCIQLTVLECSIYAFSLLRKTSISTGSPQNGINRIKNTINLEVNTIFSITKIYTI